MDRAEPAALSERWCRFMGDGAKSTGELIGDCGITRQEVDGERLHEIGYHLRRDSGDKGSRPKRHRLAKPGASRTSRSIASSR